MLVADMEQLLILEGGFSNQMCMLSIHLLLDNSLHGGTEPRALGCSSCWELSGSPSVKTPVALILDPVVCEIPTIPGQLEHGLAGREVAMILVPVERQPGQMQGSERL